LLEVLLCTDGEFSNRRRAFCFKLGSQLQNHLNLIMIQHIPSPESFLLAYKSILIEGELPETSPFDIVTFVLLGLFLDSLSYELVSFGGSSMK
jgi:hypothetical protein